MTKNYLVFDLGASNGRALIGQYDGSKFSFIEVHRFDNGAISVNNELFWDPLYLFSEIKEGIRKAKAKFDNIVSMAIDTWGCDFGLVDKDGRLINNPANYRDANRHIHSEYLHKQLSEKELFELSGGPTDRIMGIYQLYSLKYRNTTEYKNAYKLLMMPDLFNYYLTGKMANEFTNATMTLLCDQYNRKWEDKILKQFGFDEDIFIPLVEAGTRLGNIQESVCEEIGIDTIPVIIPATHDTASAVSGIPIKGNKKWAFISLGTWCISGIETNKPIINDKVLNAGFGNEGGVEGKNMLLKNITGLWIIQKCRERWMKDENQNIEWQNIDKEALSCDICDSYIDVDDERFGQSQSNMPRVISNYCKETGQEVPTTKGEITKVIYQSLVMKFRKNIEHIEQMTGEKIEKLHLVGGGTKSKLLCQWTANCIGLPIVAGPTETTSVGNFLFQLKADGQIKDIAEGRELCYNSYDTVDYVPKNQETWNKKYKKYISIIK